MGSLWDWFRKVDVSKITEKRLSELLDRNLLITEGFARNPTSASEREERQRLYSDSIGAEGFHTVFIFTSSGTDWIGFPVRESLRLLVIHTSLTHVNPATHVDITYGEERNDPALVRPYDIQNDVPMPERIFTHFTVHDSDAPGITLDARPNGLLIQQGHYLYIRQTTGHAGIDIKSTFTFRRA
jgi:hypothetical protein